MTHTNTATGATTPSLTTNQMLTLTQISQVTGIKDRKTLRTRIGQGRYPNAVQETNGRREWTVPAGDLVDAGDLDASQVTEVAATIEALRETKQLTELRTRIAELETELAVQTALAAERQAVVTTLGSVLTALSASGAER